ncbi:Integrase catalytic domain-containing protein, partial [Aphis craccivora]
MIKVRLKEDGKPKTSRYHKRSVVVKPLYERIKHEEKQLNEHIAKINNLRSPQINLTPIKDHLSSLNAKRSNKQTVLWSQILHMFNFTLTQQPKKGSGLFKDVIPQTQLVYYDDPNELVTRLNLLTSSQSVESIANELHRPVRKIFLRRSVVTRFIDDLWQADLMDMQSHSRQNYGFKYILVVIDTYSKYVWMEALKNKTSKECTNGMFNILKKAHPKLLQTDNGTEFYNIKLQNLMKKNKIKHYSSYSVIKCLMAERVIQTLKNNIFKHFTATGIGLYNTISKIIYNFSNTKHRTIKCTPNEARMNINKIKFNTQFNDTLYKPKLKVNDK